MIRTILAPVDGSPLAERALPYAKTLAQAAGARLVLLRVAPTVPDAQARRQRADDVHEAEAYLARIAEAVAPPGSPMGAAPAVTTALAYGDAGEAILAEARIQRADVVAMATHGRSGLGRWVYGSVADHVLRHAEVPVLLIAATCERAWAAGEARRVLVPLDGSEFAEAALGPGLELARALGAGERAGLLLVRVVDLPAYPFGSDPFAYPEFDPSSELGAADQYLAGVAGALRKQGHTVAVRTEVGFAAPTIAAVAREVGVGAIAMATHGRSGAARSVPGSVATGVLHHTSTPLLLVRPPASGVAHSLLGRQARE